MQAHHRIQVVVERGQLVQRTEECGEERRHHGDAPCEHHALPARPLQVEKAFHCKLTGIGARHRGALAGRQDADGPDVHSGGAVGAAQIDTTSVDVGVH